MAHEVDSAAAPERNEPDEPRFVRKLKEMREDHKDHGKIYRAAFVVAGVILTLGGVAMLLLPGPAFVVIPIGLALLSLEFAWAGNLLDKSLEKAQVAQQKAAETSTRQRVITGLALACAAAAFITWAIVGDVPLLPL
jgi:uncharacterized protein (TIGR02611 family)